MSPEQRALLTRIEALTIDPPGAALSFASRLARENGWRPDYAVRVVHEYRRFLFLAASGERAVTPSDAVDQAWHLHLAYTRSYWDDLCGSVLGRPLHHGPTAGGASEGLRYREQYAATLARYAEMFGEAAPAEIWPDVDARFAGRFERVDRSRVVVLPRAAALFAGLPLAGVVLAAASGGPTILSGMVVGIGVFVLAIVLVGAMSRPRGKRKQGDGSGCGGSSGCGSDSKDSDGGGDSGCGGGGCGGGGD